MHKVKTARPVTAAYGVFWTSPEGLVVPCEAYTIDADGRTTSGDNATAETLAGAYGRGETFLIYSAHVTKAEAEREAADCDGADYSVRALPAGTFLYDGETLCVVAQAEPAKAEPNTVIVQVWKRADLGCGWTVSFLSDGSASFFNANTHQDLRLPKHSIETLRKFMRREFE